MIVYFFAFLLALMPHHPKAVTANSNITQVTAADDPSDTGGETGHTPPKG